MEQIGPECGDMENKIKKAIGGFTLVEVVIASMLVGMVLLAAFPLIKTGRSILERRQKELECSWIGDGIFEFTMKEIQNADRMFVGTEDEFNEFCEETDPEQWKQLKIDSDGHGLDVEITLEPVEQEWMLLGVRLIEKETVLFEKEEVVPVLNFGLLKKEGLEGTGGPVLFRGDKETRESERNIWYRAISE